MTGSQPPPPAARPLALGWLVGFAVLFFCLTPRLANNPSVTRLQLVSEAPLLLLDALDPTNPEPGEPAAGWRFLSQRGPIVLAALVLLVGGWAVGRLAWRGLGRSIDIEDRWVVAGLVMGVGLSLVSLLTLACGLAGALHRSCLIGPLAVALVVELALSWKGRTGRAVGRQAIDTLPGPDRGIPPGEVIPVSTAAKTVVGGLLLLFLFFQLTGAMLPSVDFDVKEYHLQGPREFFEQGRVTRLPHNVYTSFPFLTEMLSLAGMVTAGDWWQGALVGKVVLMSFAPLTALVLFAAGRRWFSRTSGVAAAMVYLTIPWTTRTSIIAYSEGGLCFFLAATLLAVGVAIEWIRKGERATGLLVLAGLLAGSGMACKYTGLVQVVLPALVALVVATIQAARSRQEPDAGSSLGAATRTSVIFLCGVSLTIGPWLLKNLVETGNPVYPLGYTVFGGRDWSEADNVKWRAAHSSSDYSFGDLANRALDVVSRNDWQSPLVFGLAPLALLGVARRRRAVALWLLVAWLFFSWWGLTHRLDRFWLPLLPVASLLAGVGMTWSARPSWWRPCAIVVLIGVAHNLGVVTSPLVGYNAYLVDLESARQACQATAPAIQVLNRQLDEDDPTVLCVGEAQVFDARFPVRYNTVFDRSLFEEWCGDGQGGLDDAERIRERLRDRGIGWVLVNWQEILRYRTTYGYTDFVTPGVFARLREMGLLGEDRFGQPLLVPLEQLSPREHEEIQRWAKQLVVTVEGKKAYIAMQLFPVR